MKKHNTFYKILTALLAFGILLIPSLLLADPGDGDGSGTAITLPCSGQDDYSNCPLDTWVMVLAIVVLVFAVLHLNNKQKRATLAK